MSWNGIIFTLSYTTSSKHTLVRILSRHFGNESCLRNISIKHNLHSFYSKWERVFIAKHFQNLKNIHFLIWKWTKHIPACRHLYRVRLCWLAGAVPSSTRGPEDFIIPPSPPSSCTSPFPLSLSLHSFHLLFSSALLPLQLCFKCSVLHLLSISRFVFTLLSLAI